jgi:hypothetical protein
MNSPNIPWNDIVVEGIQRSLPSEHPGAKEGRMLLSFLPDAAGLNRPGDAASERLDLFHVEEAGREVDEHGPLFVPETQFSVRGGEAQMEQGERSRLAFITGQMHTRVRRALERAEEIAEGEGTLPDINEILQQTWDGLGDITAESPRIREVWEGVSEDDVSTRIWAYVSGMRDVLEERGLLSRVEQELEEAIRRGAINRDTDLELYIHANASDAMGFPGEGVASLKVKFLTPDDLFVTRDQIDEKRTFNDGHTTEGDLFDWVLRTDKDAARDDRFLGLLTRDHRARALMIYWMTGGDPPLE